MERHMLPVPPSEIRPMSSLPAPRPFFLATRAVTALSEACSLVELGCADDAVRSRKAVPRSATFAQKGPHVLIVRPLSSRHVHSRAS